MREVVAGIVGWSWLSPPHGYDFNGWLVRHPSGNVCIDPVEPEVAAERRRLSGLVVPLSTRAAAG